MGKDISSVKMALLQVPRSCSSRQSASGARAPSQAFSRQRCDAALPPLMLNVHLNPCRAFCVHRLSHAHAQSSTATGI